MALNEFELRPWLTMIQTLEGSYFKMLRKHTNELKWIRTNMRIVDDNTLLLKNMASAWRAKQG